MQQFTEGDMTALLREKYGEQGARYAFLTQVGNGTGSRADRFCDALAISLWPSDGLEWHGHEIKVSRSDWMREVKDPDKADAFAQYCHRWWIVVPDKSVAAPADLRPGWGLMVIRNGKLTVAVGAAKQEPKDPPRALLSAIMRRVVDASPAEQEVTALRRSVEDERHKVFCAESAARRDGQSLEALRQSVAAFEQASGLRIDAYSGGRLGERVAAAERARFDYNYVLKIEGIKRDLQGIAKSLDDAESAARSLVQEEAGRR